MSDPSPKVEDAGPADRPDSSEKHRAPRRRPRRSGRRGSKSSVVKGFRVTICDFPSRMSEGRLRDVVESTVGCRLISCQIARNAVTGRLERVAQAIFASRNEADRAVRILHGTTLDGERLNVRYKGMSIFTDKQTGRLASKARAAALPNSRSRIRPAGKANTAARKKDVKTHTAEELAAEAAKYMNEDDE